MVDIEAYEELIKSTNHINIDYRRANQLIALNESQLISATEELNFYLYLFRRKPRCCSITPECIKSFLLDDLKLSKKLITYKGTVSLDQDKVLKPLVSNGKLNDNQRVFIETYLQYKELRSIRDTFMRKFERCSMDLDDPSIRLMYFTTGIESTGRVYYSREAVVSIPHFFLPTICARKGKLLIWGDFAQSDLRIAGNLYFITDENRKYFENEDDYYRGFLKSCLKEDYDEEKFIENRPSLKRLVLAACYNAGAGKLNSIVNNKDLVDLTLNFYKENKRYQKFVKEFQKVIDSGLVLKLQDYFGFKRTIAVDSNKNLLSQAINTPIQSCTNSVVVNLCLKIMEEAEARGWTKDQFNIYLVRHDEPIFEFDETLIDEVKEIISPLQRIIIDDWLPMQIDFKIGKNYKEEFDEVPVKGEWKITEKEGGLKEYHPVGRVLETEIVLVENEGYWKAGFLVNKTVFSTPYSEDRNAIIKLVYKMIEKYCIANEYSIVLAQQSIKNPELKGEAIGDILVKYTNKFKMTPEIIRMFIGEGSDVLEEYVIGGNNDGKKCIR